jgi:transposase
MLGLPPSVRIYFATELVDMRNGIDGLRALVENALKKDAYGGHLFVFVGKSKDKVKILFWDRNGFVLYLKRLERGRFQLPAVIDGRTKHVAMEPAQLAMLLDGIDLNARRLARWTPSDQGIDTERRV